MLTLALDIDSAGVTVEQASAPALEVTIADLAITVDLEGGQGPTGATGPTGPTGPPGVVSTAVVVSAATYTYSIPANKWLLGWHVASGTAQSYNAGFSAGTSELAIAAATGEVLAFQFGTTGGKDIHFSGLAGTVTINFLNTQ